MAGLHLGLEIPEPIINADSLRHNLTNEGGVGNTFRFLKNIMGLWLVQQCKRIWDREGSVLGFGELMQEAEKARPFIAIVDPKTKKLLHMAN